ncbi:MAG TPA: amidohydrolase family protein, partial [Ktedonobacterales bacterium]|nr:amidohydrolase family protein [Ktedonobacterales bacterium]
MPYPTPLLLTNGVIHTMDEKRPQTESMAIDRAAGRIIAVGDEATVRAEMGIFASFEVIDLRGRTVIPGIIDAHTHILAAARDKLELNLAGCADEAAAVKRVAAHAATIPAGSWVVGRHWNQNEWPGRQFPTRGALDSAVPDHPCVLWTHSQHAAWVNAVALARAGITRDTADPPGGVIARDADGEPAGMLFEEAATPIFLMSEAEAAAEERSLHALRDLLRDFAARGITGVNTMEGEHSLRLAQQIYRAGDLPLRVGYYLPV